MIVVATSSPDVARCDVLPVMSVHARGISVYGSGALDTARPIVPFVAVAAPTATTRVTSAPLGLLITIVSAALAPAALRAPRHVVAAHESCACIVASTPVAGVATIVVWLPAGTVTEYQSTRPAPTPVQPVPAGRGPP